MKTIAPDYYRRFQCIAGACRHSCCIGWEIGIDPETLARYQTEGGEMGGRLRRNIEVTEDGACFRLQGVEERCPFLNERGLCDLILTLGEGALCQICTDHPRFRHFDADRTEVGLGLCCEEAVRLILHQQEPMMLEVLEDDGATEETDPEELALRSLRGQLFALIQDRTQPMEARVEKLCAFAGFSADAMDWAQWSAFLLTLERLDDRWADHLHALAHAPAGIPALVGLQEPLEQLLTYFLFRHLHGALDDGDVRGRIALCVLLWLIVAHLALRQPDQLCEYARLCSTELEYSEDNLAELLDAVRQRLFADFLQ